VLHERVLLVSIVTEEIPFVRSRDRATVTPLGAGFHQVIARYGFMQMADVPALLASLTDSIPGSPIDKESMDTSYYLGRETLLPYGPAKLATWRKRLFIYLARNSQTASSFFGLPSNRVVELGAQIQL
jgi:KUP system potassium uptake protein